MPELPEVETIAEGLRRHVVGWQITGIKFWRDNLREPFAKQQIRRAVRDQQITSIERRAKYIVIHTAEDRGMLVHLGMTGSFQQAPTPEQLGKHAHVGFRLKRGQQTRYLQLIDPRRFGRLDAFFGDCLQHRYLAKAGVEPLTTTNLGQHLWHESRNRTVAIKNFLMDGRIVSGLGNIYAAESLYHAQLYPFTPAKDLDQRAYQRLAVASQQVLQRAVKAGGTTFRDYQDLDGNQGYFTVQLAVYGRQDQPCNCCQTKIVLVRQGGRSTFYCPTCQPDAIFHNI